VPTPPRDWIALRIEAPCGVADAVTNFLLELGSPAVVTDDVDPGRTRIEGSVLAESLASATAAVGRYLDALAAIEPDAAAARVEAVPVAPIDWTAVSRRHHRPVLVGDRLLVAPPWEVPSAPGREILVIEPGMAFGTGQHATTRGCLEAIEHAVGGGAVGSALDVGTGSGILALALARLGVERVVAIDTDPAVLPLARANLAQNGAARVTVSRGSVATVEGTFDLVVANLLAEAIVAEAAALAHAVAPGGRLVVSGLLATQAEAVRAAYPGWRLTETRGDEVWRTLTLERDG
jgi:ribosomal protein L11 methyltransferase